MIEDNGTVGDEVTGRRICRDVTPAALRIILDGIMTNTAVIHGRIVLIGGIRAGVDCRMAGAALDSAAVDVNLMGKDDIPRGCRQRCGGILPARSGQDRNSDDTKYQSDNSLHGAASRDESRQENSLAR
jgi:hypothetical protein